MCMLQWTDIICLICLCCLCMCMLRNLWTDKRLKRIHRQGWAAALRDHLLFGQSTWPRRRRGSSPRRRGRSPRNRNKRIMVAAFELLMSVCNQTCFLAVSNHLSLSRLWHTIHLYALCAEQSYVLRNKQYHCTCSTSNQVLSHPKAPSILTLYHSALPLWQQSNYACHHYLDHGVLCLICQGPTWRPQVCYAHTGEQ